MTDKFGRNYILEVQGQFGDTIQVTLPFTIEFDIVRHTLSSAQSAKIRLYNLGRRTRSQIQYNISNLGSFRAISLRAGYGDNPPIIFTGNISQAWSFREGVNFITQIECYDGGFALSNGFASSQYPEGTPYKTIVTSLISQMPNVSMGAVGSIPGTTSRGQAYNGLIIDILNDINNGGVFIDSGKVNVIGSAEYIDDNTPAILVNSATGLLGTPLLEQSIARFEMIFEPGLRPGYLANLDSSTGVNFNGLNKITAVSHKGMISDAVCGSVVTTGEFFYNYTFSPVSIVNG